MLRCFVLGLVVPFLPFPLDSAIAAAVTCQGENATIVGSRGLILRGTPGDDVIVTNGARSVDAGAGDDRVCVTGGWGGRVHVTARSGDDRVVVRTDRSPGTWVALGGGEDTFIGGRGADTVAGHTLGISSAWNDQERDVIRTGAGNDFVQSGEAASMNDVVDLGSGADHVRVYAPVMAPGAALRGGPGNDMMEFGVREDATEVVVDNTPGTAAVDGAQAWAWDSFQRIAVREGAGASVDFVGGPSSETFSADGAIRSAALGDGDDTLSLGLLHAGDPPPTISGGAGADFVGLGFHLGSIDVDLPQDRADLSEPGLTVHIPGIEGASAAAETVRMRGDDAANRLFGRSCHTVIEGGSGADELGYLPGERPSSDCVIRTLLYGQQGPDRLYGGNKRDDLFGGPGFDRGDGSRGIDRCVGVERRINCER